MNRKKIICGLIYTLLGVYYVSAQTSQKLPATNIIGTALSVDYSNNASSTTVNTKANAFDGKLNTYFASYERSGTWVGLDLGERHVITKIAYCPRNDYEGGPNRLVLGMFEGANSPDFGDAMPLFMITDLPMMNVMTEQTIQCTKGFRYVRYVGPNDVRCNIAEIEFYGYKSVGSNSYYYQLSNIPTLVITTTGALEITSKDKYIKGMITIINYQNDGTVYSDSLEIRGRGHASWNFPKKPYRIKLQTKTNLLGMPAREKSWVLINNYGDKTLMRNMLAYEISKRLDMDYTPAGVPVDLILNGEYKGTYNLCDQIEVARNRVDVEEMTKNDLTLPNLSGGYMLEVDAYAYQEVDYFTSQYRRTPIRVRYPQWENISPIQFYYIYNHYTLMEIALFANNYKDPLNGYRKYIDTESFIRHFLVGELSGNTDTYWSTYIYKKRNEDVLRFGPVWDLDLGFDNDWRTYPINSHSQWVYEYGSTANGFREVVNRLFSDQSFVDQLKAIYAHYRSNGLITKESMQEVIKDYANLLSQSQRLNFMRWNIMNYKVHENPVIHGSYSAEVENVRRYLTARIDWMDKKLGYDPSVDTPAPPEVNPVKVYANENAVCIDGVIEPVQISIIDVTGRTLVYKLISNNTVFPIPKGFYFVTINAKTVKCIVK